MTESARDGFAATLRRAEWVQGQYLLEFLRTARAMGLPQAEWLELPGGVVGFFGVKHPYCRARGVGVGDSCHAMDPAVVQRFLAERGSPARLEVTFATSPSLLDGLRGRLAIESWLHVHVVSLAALDEVRPPTADGVTVEVVTGACADACLDVIARGFHGDDPLPEHFRDHGRVVLAMRDGVSYLARVDGEPAGGGRVDWFDVPDEFGGGRVALLTGASVVAKLRRRGAQRALLAARLRAAAANRCQTAFVLSAPASDSERNIARAGFRFMYAKAVVVARDDT